MKIPPLYPVLDADLVSASCAPGELLHRICANAVALFESGCTVLQLRGGQLGVRQQLRLARELRRLLPQATLIIHDRADLCLAAAFDGVHLDQQGLSPQGSRIVVGNGRIVGLATHNATEFAQAVAEPVDFITLGPIFADNGLGLAGIAEARRQLDAAGRDLPLVAAGGITPDNAKFVLQAGAASVAVTRDISSSPSESAREFFRLMM